MDVAEVIAGLRGLPDDVPVRVAVDGEMVEIEAVYVEAGVVVIETVA